MITRIGTEMTAAASIRGGNCMRLSSTVGIVWNPVGAPRIATGPKITAAETNTRIEPAMRAGAMTGKVTVRSTRHREAPRLAAACSRAGSIPSSAADTGRNTSG